MPAVIDTLLVCLEIVSVKFDILKVVEYVLITKHVYPLYPLSIAKDPLLLPALPVIG